MGVGIREWGMEAGEWGTGNRDRDRDRGRDRDRDRDRGRDREPSAGSRLPFG